MKKLTMLLALLLASGSLLAAGCGDDDDDGGGDATPAAVTDAGAAGTQTDAGATDATATTDTTEPADSGGGSTNSAAAQAAKDGCEAGIKNNPALDASKRDGLSEECQKVADAAASGDLTKYKAAYRTFCGKLADALPEQAQAAARSACEQGANAIPGG